MTKFLIAAGLVLAAAPALASSPSSIDQGDVAAVLAQTACKADFEQHSPTHAAQDAIAKAMGWNTRQRLAAALECVGYEQARGIERHRPRTSKG